MAEPPRLTEAEILVQFEAAREAERIADQTEPRARAVRYDEDAGRIVVELKSGGAFAFPPDQFEELAGRPAEDLRAVEPSPSGEGLEWEALDVHISVPGILAHMLGPELVRAFAARGGRSTSDKKAAAARANGRKGGRPRGGAYRALPGSGDLTVREEKREAPGSG
jgi:hypothetical protein